MSPQVRVNRVEADLREWKAREEHLAKLFSASPTINSTLLKERLKYYDYLFLKFKDRASLEESLILQILKKEKKGMLVTLYPNVALRLLKAVVNFAVSRPIEKSNYAKQVLDNNKYLENQLQQIGFKDVFKKVQRFIEKGEPKFSITVSNYINEKDRMDYNLDFNYIDNGQYKFEGYQAVLENNHKPNEERSYYFKTNEENNFSLNEVYNLLSGRSVKKGETWIQFDLNDKDADGHYRLKEFQESYGYNIEKALSQLPLKLLHPSELTTMIDSLKGGGRQEAALLKDQTVQKIFIEADPHHKCLILYNESLKKVSLANRLEKGTVNEKPHKKGIEVQRSIKNKRQVRSNRI